MVKIVAGIDLLVSAKQALEISCRTGGSNNTQEKWIEKEKSQRQRALSVLTLSRQVCRYRKQLSEGVSVNDYAG